MSERLTTALVTGASAGLGAEFCRQLAPLCDRIVAVARRADRLQSLVRDLAQQAEVVPLAADLNGVEGVARCMEAIRQRGPLDYLVNNAGFGTFGRFIEQPINSQRDMVSLHVDAAITLCRAAIPFMREQGGGHIINVSSLGAFLPGRGPAVYGATKAFLNHFSLALQQELAGTGIEVQALCPGYIRTEFHEDMAAAGFDRSRIPDEMWMEASEVVSASLDALGSGRVLVVPGARNVELAREGLAEQLAGLN
jgi:short-subunit dehydrogenase